MTDDPAPKKRRRDPVKAREAVLDAALKRFSTHGYVGTRIADVARDAGCSEALVYFHFQSKDALFREVVSRIDADAKWFDPDDSPEGFVARMRDGELRYHQDVRWRALDRVWSEALGGEPELLGMIRPQLEQALGSVEALLARYDRSGTADRRKLALLLSAVSYGARVMRRYDPDAISPEDAADVLAIAAEAVLERLGVSLPSPTPAPGPTPTPRRPTR